MMKTRRIAKIGSGTLWYINKVVDDFTVFSKIEMDTESPGSEKNNQNGFWRKNFMLPRHPFL